MLLGMRAFGNFVVTIVGKLLLEDSSSKLLMENGTDKILGEG